MGVPVYALSFSDTMLYCLVTETHGCEQLDQSRYSAAWRPGLEPSTVELDSLV